MPARLRVRAGVPVRRVVAAPDVAAAEADPQVQPSGACAKAVLAAVRAVGQALEGDLVEMGAGVTVASASSPIVDRDRQKTWHYLAVTTFSAPNLVHHAARRLERRDGLTRCRRQQRTRERGRREREQRADDEGRVVSLIERRERA